MNLIVKTVAGALTSRYKRHDEGKATIGNWKLSLSFGSAFTTYNTRISLKSVETNPQLISHFLLNPLSIFRENEKNRQTDDL